MQEKMIGSIFRKLIYESSDMVFLTEDTFPYPIIYSNKSFEEQIGTSLTDGSLIGLGLDVSSIILKEELHLNHNKNDYVFTIELSQNSPTNHFLFYNGKSFRSKELPSNKEFQQFFLHGIDPQLVLKPDGEIFFSNTAALTLFGYASSAKLNHIKEVEGLFNDPQQWKKWISSAISESVTYYFSSIVYSLMGESQTLSIASKQLIVSGNQYVLLSFQNISEKVTLERDLEDSSNFLKNLTDQVPGGMYQLVLSNEGHMNIAFLSKGIAQVLGLQPEELESSPDISTFISKIHPRDLPQVIISSITSARNVEAWQCQFRVKSDPNSDKYRWILGSARPQALANGDLVCYGYLTDISEQKEFETTLDVSRRAAEKASQIKSDFLSMISHELRTPLNAISGSTYSLLQEGAQPHQMAALDTINFAVDNLIVMINDLLDFQKIDAGKLTIEKAPFHLIRLVRQTVKGLAFHAKDSKNKLDVVFSNGLNVIVCGDKTRLSQVLNNLITNALKFTNNGEVKVKVELRESTSNSVKVYFEVSDNGIGIAQEHQEKIFNDFDQVRPTFSAKYGGTGLGLSITRRLLNLMGGKIGLQSTLDKGSSFFFELEFDLGESHLDDPIDVPEYLSHGSLLHLLMAEDNDVNAMVLGKIIHKWGFTYERVINGLEAVKAVKSSNFDCILMDIQMPEMNGFEATLAIKKITDSPVIALTAAAKHEIIDQIQECDFDGYVAKPIDASELHKIILAVISAKNHSI